MKRKHLTNIQAARVFQGLSLLVHAGIPIGDGLFYLAEQGDNELGPLMQELGQKMDGGNSLAAAMQISGAFASHAIGMVSVGEQTGHIEEVLCSLYDYYCQRDRTDRQIKSAIVYPMSLLLLILTVIAVLLIKVLPIFDSVYASLGSRLTGAAAALLAVGNAAADIMPLLIAALAAAAIFLLLFSQSESFRNGVIAKLKRFGPVKAVFQKFNNARFAQAMAMGLCSGILDEQVLELSAELLRDDQSAVDKCGSCRELLSQGETLPQALSKTGMLPKAECKMIELGMRTGNGDKAAKDIAQRLYEQAESNLEQRIGQIEPVMVLIASLLVAAILLSVLLPLINIMSAIG